jgi:uncharacterized secreted repeat protein (TIGR03808 family)
MVLDRRTVLGATAGLGTIAAANVASTAGPRQAEPNAPKKSDDIGHVLPGTAGDALIPNSPDMQTALLQSLIDRAAERGVALILPAGRFRSGSLTLPANTKLIGSQGLTVIQFVGPSAFLKAERAANIVIEAMVLDGGMQGALDDEDAAVCRLNDCQNVMISRSIIGRTLANGIVMQKCSGRIIDCSISTVSMTGIRCIDSIGVEISHNHISKCSNNGLQVWRTAAGEDGTLIHGNRIDSIQNRSGGTGEYGNGINVFRAGNVVVSNNRIADCSYSAIRGNAASNIQILGNSCSRLGEVAIFSEFGFEGAMICNNLIDSAATGISVTNFNDGGRLAVVQGNLIRNLSRREFEKEDKCGDGITIEADTIVSGNVIENAATSGIRVGWGPYMRNCIISHNLVRDVRAGIVITNAPDAGACLVTANMITGATDGAIRLMDYGKVLGPDLAKETPKSPKLSISGNVTS